MKSIKTIRELRLRWATDSCDSAEFRAMESMDGEYGQGCPLSPIIVKEIMNR